MNPGDTRFECRLLEHPRANRNPDKLIGTSGSLGPSMRSLGANPANSKRDRRPLPRPEARLAQVGTSAGGEGGEVKAPIGQRASRSWVIGLTSGLSTHSHALRSRLRLLLYRGITCIRKSGSRCIRTGSRGSIQLTVGRSFSLPVSRPRKRLQPPSRPAAVRRPGRWHSARCRGQKPWRWPAIRWGTRPGSRPARSRPGILCCLRCRQP